VVAPEIPQNEPALIAFLVFRKGASATCASSMLAAI